MWEQLKEVGCSYLPSFISMHFYDLKNQFDETILCAQLSQAQGCLSKEGYEVCDNKGWGE